MLKWSHVVSSRVRRMKNPRAKRLSTLASVVGPAAFAVSMSTVAPPADADFFVKFDGIPGEARDAEHKGEIDVLAWSWGMSRAVSAAGGGGDRQTGKVAVQELSLTKWVDKASPILMMRVATGQVVPEVTFSVTEETDGGQRDYFIVTMEEVIVSSVSSGGSTGDDSGRPSGDPSDGTLRHTENVTLNFARVQVHYTPLDEKGLGTPTEFKWDISRNDTF